MVLGRPAGTTTIIFRNADGDRTATTAITLKTPAVNNNIITVRASDVAGLENIRLKVGNTTIPAWTLTTPSVNRTATTTAIGGILVEYFNGATGHEVHIHNIVVNGTTSQAENMTHNTGVWQNNRCGGSRSESLHCNGPIGFGNVITGRPAQVEKVEEGMYLRLNRKINYTGEVRRTSEKSLIRERIA